LASQRFERVPAQAGGWHGGCSEGEAEGWMHELAFRLKRAHLRAVELHKPLAKEYELTPARFDAMLVIWRCGGKCLQSRVWRELGLAPSTISRMLKAMAEKGLVWREVSQRSLRERAVGFTSYGLDCVVRAIKALIRADTLREVWDRIHGEGRAFVARTIDAVRRVGRGLSDSSTHAYGLDAPSEGDVAAADTKKEEMRFHAELREWRRNGGRAPRPLSPEVFATAPPTTAMDAPLSAEDAWEQYWARFHAQAYAPPIDVAPLPPEYDFLAVTSWQELWTSIHAPGYEQRRAEAERLHLAHFHAAYANDDANADANGGTDVADADYARVESQPRAWIPGTKK